jgi:CheY-like chemotaxis protein
MVVEDDAIIGGLLAELLNALGHEVCAIEASESSAVAVAGRSKPDLMIIDAQLQDGSGIRAVETINRFVHIPHIFVCFNASRVRAIKPDSIVLQKPYFESDLVLAIQSALRASLLRVTCDSGRFRTTQR